MSALDTEPTIMLMALALQACTFKTVLQKQTQFHQRHLRSNVIGRANSMCITNASMHPLEADALTLIPLGLFAQCLTARQ